MNHPMLVFLFTFFSLSACSGQNGVKKTMEQPSGEEWFAYGQYAVNLRSLVADSFTEEVFPELEIRLERISINYVLTEKYELPFLGTLLGDDYAELSPKETPFTL